MTKADDITQEVFAIRFTLRHSAQLSK